MSRNNRELPPAVEAAGLAWDSSRSTERLWSRDPSLWPEGAAKWLGWLDAATPARATLDELTSRAHAVAPEATSVLLIGMGGSSLAPEVIARTIPRGPGGRALHILDSTEPAYVREMFARTDWRRTIVLVASKSGTTLEPDILLAAALAEAERVLGDEVGRHCLAITDPGSALERHARERGFADVFHGEPSIGGRFSALSPFGLVPAALHGIVLDDFVKPARAMVAACHAPAAANPGVQLGAFFAMTMREGRDKCTLMLPPSLASMGAWIEQLLAESTGKGGVMVLPIDGEEPGEVETYGADRAFVHVRSASGEDTHERRMRALEQAGFPVFTIEVASPTDLAGEFFRWEFATAVAGSLIGINPFDQPDVESSKVATRRITEALERGEAPPKAPPDTLDDLEALLGEIRPGDYFAILAFLPMFPEVHAALQRIREHVRIRYGVATTAGFGPRFLHSTGQAFKGGPNTGVFLQLTCEAAEDVPIPGRKLSFGDVVSAQAAGDLAVLREKGRRCCRLHLGADLAAELRRIEDLVAR